jgi:hypothetical protein
LRHRQSNSQDVGKASWSNDEQSKGLCIVISPDSLTLTTWYDSGVNWTDLVMSVYLLQPVSEVQIFSHNAFPYTFGQEQKWREEKRPKLEHLSHLK